MIVRLINRHPDRGIVGNVVYEYPHVQKFELHPGRSPDLTVGGASVLRIDGRSVPVPDAGIEITDNSEGLE